MDNRKNDIYYIRKIREDLSFIARHTFEVDQEELGRNE